MSKITCAICLEKKPLATTTFHSRETFTIKANENCAKCVDKLRSTLSGEENKHCIECKKAPKTYKGKMVPVCAGCDNE
jgi:hypothetical protein